MYNFKLKDFLPDFLIIPLRYIKKIILNNYQYHYLRYHNFIKVDYKIDGSLLFGNKETNFFLTNLKKSKVYLEYGSGNSTLIADKLNKTYYSIESDRNFFSYIIKKLKKNKIYFTDFGVVSFYSNPLKFENRKKEMSNSATSYSFNILKKLKNKNIYPDLILVDGRFRVLVGLYLYKFFLNNKKPFTIIFDDYFLNFKNSGEWDRKHYHELNNFFNIKKIGRFGVTKKLKKKNKKNLSKNINKYKFDFR